MLDIHVSLTSLTRHAHVTHTTPRHTYMSSHDKPSHAAWYM